MSHFERRRLLLLLLVAAGTPAEFYRRFQHDIAAVTEKDVLRAAREHLPPEQLLIVILGDADKIQAASPAAGYPLDAHTPVEVVRR